MVANYTLVGDSFIPQRPRLWCGKRLATQLTDDDSKTMPIDWSSDGQRYQSNALLLPVACLKPI
jgi:hypothetical protein